MSVAGSGAAGCHPLCSTAVLHKMLRFATATAAIAAAITTAAAVPQLKWRQLAATEKNVYT